MSLFKTARYFQTKIAQFVGADLAGKLQQAMGLASALVSDLEIYDPGYEECAQIASKLHDLWKTSTQKVDAEDKDWLFARVESVLPSVKNLLGAAKVKVNFESGKAKLNQLASVVNSIDLFAVSTPDEFKSSPEAVEPTFKMKQVVEDLAQSRRPSVDETEGYFGPG